MASKSQQSCRLGPSPLPAARACLLAARPFPLVLLLAGRPWLLLVVMGWIDTRTLPIHQPTTAQPRRLDPACPLLLPMTAPAPAAAHDDKEEKRRRDESKSTSFFSP
jgi:hypothetical protein